MAEPVVEEEVVKYVTSFMVYNSSRIIESMAESLTACAVSAGVEITSSPKYTEPELVSTVTVTSSVFSIQTRSASILTLAIMVAVLFILRQILRFVLKPLSLHEIAKLGFVASKSSHTQSGSIKDMRLVEIRDENGVLKGYRIDAGDDEGDTGTDTSSA